MAPAIDDSMQARISADCDEDTRTLLYHAWAHDTSDLKKLLDAPGKASAQDPKTGETPLHAAIRACGPSPHLQRKPDDDDVGHQNNGQNGEDQEDPDDTVAQEAGETVHKLFLSGAIWNDADNNDETPGCVALRLGQRDLYQLCVEAGVRAELLFGLLDGYEELSSGSAGEEEEAEIIEVEGQGQGENGGVEVEGDGVVVVEGEPDKGDGEKEKVATEKAEAETGESQAKRQKTGSESEPDAQDKQDVNSEQYLASNLTYDSSKLVDDEGNGVMMAWETSIMRRSVDALLRADADSDADSDADADADKKNDKSRSETDAPPLSEGKRILNIGFGMGIIDAMFASTKPTRHHIIEAHPAVLAHIDAGNTSFGPDWEASAPAGEGAYKVHRGRWQDVVPRLLEAGEVYDAIYFDTFGEDYSQLRMFFTEHIPGLMDQEGRLGFFNGLGADRRICYDVYTKVVEMHMVDAGMDVEWDEIDVDVGEGSGMDEAGRGEWEGVRRRYWTLDKYRLPMCTFMG